MATFEIPEAEMRIEELIDRAEAGEEVIITRDGAPVVKLTPIDTSDAPAHAGTSAV